MATATIRARSSNDWIKTFIWNRSDNAALTGRTLALQARREAANEEILLDLDSASKGGIEVVDAASRKFKITIPRGRLGHMLGETVFDLVCVETDGIVLPILEGKIITVQGVRR